MGEGSLPTGGYDGTEEAWAAIIDVPNGWVQIGSYQKEAMENSCMEYNSLHDAPPEWGIVGHSDEDRTPHIMCCKEPPGHYINGMDVSVSVAVAETKKTQATLGEMVSVK